MQHDWVKSTLGHGNQMCRRCFVTDLEAAAISMTECRPLPDNGDPYLDDAGMICPVTEQPCLTEQDEFCEDYGCARKAGIDVDRDLVQ